MSTPAEMDLDALLSRWMGTPAYDDMAHLVARVRAGERPAGAPLRAELRLRERFEQVDHLRTPQAARDLRQEMRLDLLCLLDEVRPALEAEQFLVELRALLPQDMQRDWRRCLEGAVQVHNGLMEAIARHTPDINITDTPVEVVGLLAGRLEEAQEELAALRKEGELNAGLLRDFSALSGAVARGEPLPECRTAGAITVRASLADRDAFRRDLEVAQDELAKIRKQVKTVTAERDRNFTSLKEAAEVVGPAMGVALVNIDRTAEFSSDLVKERDSARAAYLELDAQCVTDKEWLARALLAHMRRDEYFRGAVVEETSYSGKEVLRLYTSCADRLVGEAARATVNRVLPSTPMGKAQGLLRERINQYIPTHALSHTRAALKLVESWAALLEQQQAMGNDDLVKERDGLSERENALEGAVSRLRDGLWQRGFAAAHPSEAGSVVDCALATIEGVASRLAAIHQRAGAVSPRNQHVARYIVGDDAPAPSEMDRLRGEMAESPCPAPQVAGGKSGAAHPPEPTAAEAFATVRRVLRGRLAVVLRGALPQGPDAGEVAVALLERRMKGLEEWVENLVRAATPFRDWLVHSGGAMGAAPGVEQSRAFISALAHRPTLHSEQRVPSALCPSDVFDALSEALDWLENNPTDEQAQGARRRARLALEQHRRAWSALCARMDDAAIEAWLEEPQAPEPLSEEHWLRAWRNHLLQEFDLGGPPLPAQPTSLGTLLAGLRLWFQWYGKDAPLAHGALGDLSLLESHLGRLVGLFRNIDWADAGDVSTLAAALAIEEGDVLVTLECGAVTAQSPSATTPSARTPSITAWEAPAASVTGRSSDPKPES